MNHNNGDNKKASCWGSFPSTKHPRFPSFFLF